MPGGVLALGGAAVVSSGGARSPPAAASLTQRSADVSAVVATLQRRRPISRVLWAGCWCCEPAPRNRLTSTELLRRRPWFPHTPSRWSRCRRARRTIFLLLSNDRSSLAGYAMLVFVNAAICLSIFVMLVASLPQYRAPAMTAEDADALAVLNSIEAVTVRRWSARRRARRVQSQRRARPPPPPLLLLLPRRNGRSSSSPWTLSGGC